MNELVLFGSILEFNNCLVFDKVSNKMMSNVDVLGACEC